MSAPKLPVENYRSSISSIIVQQREHVVPRQFLATSKKIQLDHKCQSRNLPAQSARQLRSRDRRASRSQQIVDDQNALTFSDRIFLALHRVASEFQFVADLHRFGGRLSGLANRDESRT